VHTEELDVSRSDDQAKPKARGWPRYLRLNLRGMIVLVLVTGGWLGWWIRSATIQRAAVAAIERGGGYVAYNWEYLNGRAIRRKVHSPPWPRWLVHRIGVDYFGYVIKVQNVSPGNGDAGLASIAVLERLEELQLGGFLVTDSGLKHLEGLRSLKVLDLSSCDLTDRGVAHLRGLTGLKVLDLKRTWVTDAGLVHLKGLINLQVLDLEETQVTDAGIRELEAALPGTTIRH
jgi:hypothetical protein